MALRNHEMFVQLGNLLDELELGEAGAEKRLEEFCEYHHFRSHERPTFEKHQALIIEYMKIKNKHPKRPDRLIAKFLNINKTTLIRIKAEFNVSKNGKNLVR